MANTLKFGNGQWATGNGTALAYNDENANFKPLPFDFTRASSGTTVNQSGLIETVGSGIPRIDFLGNTEGALLLEPARTNSIAYSNDLNASGWNTFSTDGGTVTRTSNYGISPSGKQDSTRVVFTTQFVSLYYSFSGISGDASATMYVKGVAGKVIAFGFGSDVSFGQEFTLNGQWQRIEFNATSTNTTLNINAWGSTRDASDIEVYGVQLEEGSYATSYIPTSGSAVTRVAEQVNNTNSLMSGLTDMAMFVDYKLPSGQYDGFRNEIGFRNNSNANLYFIQFPNSNTHEFRYRGVAGVNVDMTPSISEQDFGLRRKILYTKTGTTLKVFCNGVQVSTVTSASATTFATTPQILKTNTNYDIDLNINDWKLYSNGFTDAEAIALTQV